MSVKRASGRLFLGLVLAFALTVGADRLFADSCEKSCGCGVTLVCVAGAGCTCSTFNMTLWDCGIFDSGGGCQISCGPNTTSFLCCSDYCQDQG